VKDYINIGSTPCEEECAQVGSEDYGVRALAECRRFIEAIRLKLGPEPDGARLTVKAFQHDLGTYHEVVCYHDDDNEAATQYAYDCESQAPERWTDTEPLPTTRCSTCNDRGAVNGDGLCARCAAGGDAASDPVF
jgi:hypothetical protein